MFLHRVLVSVLAAFSLCGLAQAAVAAERSAVTNWTGFYAGVNAGYAVADNQVDGAVYGSIPPFPPNNGPLLAGTGAQGWLAGLQAGYNWTSGRLLFGTEADLQASNQKGSACLSNCAPV